MPSIERPSTDMRLERVDFDDYRAHFRTNEGRFIRIGRLVVVAPKSQDESLFNRRHWKLLHAVMTSESLAAARDAEVHYAFGNGEPILYQKSTTEEGRTPTILNDAGYLHLGLPGRHHIEQPHQPIRAIILHGHAETYTRPAPEARLLSGQVFRAILGESFDVSIQQPVELRD